MAQIIVDAPTKDSVVLYPNIDSPHQQAGVVRINEPKWGRDTKKEEEEVSSTLVFRSNTIGGSPVKEIWTVVPDDDRLLDPDAGGDLLWASSIEDAVIGLRQRYPAPQGFTYISQPYSSRTEIHVNTGIISTGSGTTNDAVLEAIEDGHTLLRTHDYSARSLLGTCGYSVAESHYLLDCSRMELIPLRGNLVMSFKEKRYGPRSRDYKIYANEQDYAAAMKSLAHSQKCRRGKMKNGKSLPRPTVVTRDHIAMLLRGLKDTIRAGTNMPYSVRFEATSRWKGYAAQELLVYVKWYVKVLRNHGYRTLPRYKSLIKVWADERNRKKTRKDMETRMGHDQRQVDYMVGFLKWLEEELAYCRKRGWKYAKDPVPVEAKKKKK
jgi:hypothetical protein